MFKVVPVDKVGSDINETVKTDFTLNDVKYDVVLKTTMHSSKNIEWACTISHKDNEVLHMDFDRDTNEWVATDRCNAIHVSTVNNPILVAKRILSPIGA